jgi:hypothetical protein
MMASVRHFEPASPYQLPHCSERAETTSRPYFIAVAKGIAVAAPPRQIVIGGTALSDQCHIAARWCFFAMIYGSFAFLHHLARRMASLLLVVLVGALAIAPVAAWAQRGTASPADRSGSPAPSAGLNALDCLTLAIVHEAGYEPVEGQQAVAQVILNRLNVASYPKTICGVVYQGSERRTGCQFTFTCDGSLRRKVPEKVFLAARNVAQSALEGTLPNRVGHATHYHAHYVSPYWAPSLAKVGRIGAHIFYRGAARSRPENDHQPSPLVPSHGLPTAADPKPVFDRPFLPWGLPLVRNADSLTERPTAN